MLAWREAISHGNATKVPVNELGRTAVLWTGGKDSSLALFRALAAGARVRCLATFVPETNVDYGAHPISVMKRQAKELGLEHRLIPISQPYREGYVSALAELREQFQLDCVVTGDIDFVDGHPNWITECCQGLNLRVFNPLWQVNREELLRELISRGITAKVTWIQKGRLPRTWLGRVIDESFVEDILALSAATGIDICGENGEYHTMVAAFPPTRIVVDQEIHESERHSGRS